MRPWGFSTGALSPGNIRRALEMLRPLQPTAIELSALRTSEVQEVMEVAREYDLSAYEYVSLHVPSKWNGITEIEFLKLADKLIQQGMPLILHPDAITAWEAWCELGSQVVIENMDGRKPAGRTVEELVPVFEILPQARFCFDIGHAYQIDASMKLGRALLSAFGDRLSEIHLSNVNDQYFHESLTAESMQAYESLLNSVPGIPLILETPVRAEAISQQRSLIQNVL